MANKNVYARDLTEYLKTVNNLKINRNSLKTVAKRITLSRDVLGVSIEPTSAANLAVATISTGVVE